MARPAEKSCTLSPASQNKSALNLSTGVGFRATTTGMGKLERFLLASVPNIRRSWCSSARPATCRGASCCPASSICRAPASFPAAASSASRSTTSTPTASASIAREALDEFVHAQGQARPTGPRSPQTLDYVPLGAGARGAARRRSTAREADARRREPPAALSQRAAERRAVGRAAARATPGSSSARASSWRSRSAPISRARSRSTRKLHEVFAEEQIFRIDHFLGKEPAQNILAFRFANGLFEPIWNRNFIDHVQIDVPETLGLGKRAGVLRADRRLSRHGGHAPVPDPRLHGDGAADGAGAGADQRGEEQGLPQHAADRADATSCAGSTPATAPRRASTRSPTPRPSSR